MVEKKQKKTKNGFDPENDESPTKNDESPTKNDGFCTKMQTAADLSRGRSYRSFCWGWDCRYLSIL